MELNHTVTTPRKEIAKPDKPWEGFPLYWHPRGYWMKKYLGIELRYEADADKSFERWEIDKKRMDDGDGAAQVRRRFLLKDAINLYLTRQKQQMDDGEISPGRFAKCRAELEHHLPKSVATKIPLDAFRATSPLDDGPSRRFRAIRAKAISRGLNAAVKHIIIVRATLDYAVERKLMLPPDYGDSFNPPSQSRIDKERHERDAEHGDRLWDSGEIRKILGEADRVGRERKTSRGIKPPYNADIKAQILLALFAGFGSDDCSAVPENAVNFKTGVVKFPRVKNGRPRLVILPKLALDAIRWSIKHREPASDEAFARLLFRTAGGSKCNIAASESDDKGVKRVGRNDTIGKNFTRLLKRIGLNKYRTGFKTLRACCRTMLVGSGVNDDVVAVIMGRKFNRPVDDFYIRGELRSEMFKASKHIESVLFKKQTGSRH